MSLTISLARDHAIGVPRFRRLRRGMRRVLTAISKPHKAAMSRLIDMPLTLAGSGLIDFAAFQLGLGWGALITGLTLMVIEHMIADD